MNMRNSCLSLALQSSAIWPRVQHSERVRQGAEARSHELQRELGGRSHELQRELSQAHGHW